MNRHFELKLITISTVLILAASKTIALGMVATGSIKAYEHVIVAGSIKYMGLTLIATAFFEKDF